jgi:dephospho-CoA kinase
MRVLGLTGGIGSGKSLVDAIFRELGADVIDADALAREVVEPGQPALAEIVASFGSDVLLPDGRLNRARLAALIFGDAAARQRLNAITHPRIRRRMTEEVAARSGRSGVLVLDIPLLYENGRGVDLEKVIVVWVDQATQRRRLMERDGLTLEQAGQRIAAQMPLDEKRRRGDHVIDNSGSPESTRRQVDAIYRLYA